jgi:hypothetical protein
MQQVIRFRSLTLPTEPREYSTVDDIKLIFDGHESQDQGGRPLERSRRNGSIVGCQQLRSNGFYSRKLRQPDSPDYSITVFPFEFCRC